MKILKHTASFSRWAALYLRCVWQSRPVLWLQFCPYNSRHFVSYHLHLQINSLLSAIPLYRSHHSQIAPAPRSTESSSASSTGATTGTTTKRNTRNFKYTRSCSNSSRGVLIGVPKCCHEFETFHLRLNEFEAKLWSGLYRNKMKFSNYFVERDSFNLRAQKKARALIKKSDSISLHHQKSHASPAPLARKSSSPETEWYLWAKVCWVA